MNEKDIKTLPQGLKWLVQKQPDRIAMRMKDYGIWHDITWKQYYENVKKVAMGLHALGVKPFDHVAIVGENKPQWLFSAMGVMSLGGIFVGVYTTNPMTECEYVVGHSESVVFFCEDEEQFDKALAFRERTPYLKKIIVWDMEGLKHFNDFMLMSFDKLLEMGAKVDQEKPGLYERIVDEGKTEETASIIYTSGTTGPPKGAQISHHNYLWIARQSQKITKMSVNDETISFLPLNHVYEQIFDLMMHLTTGHIVNFTENTDTVMNDLRDVSPTLFHAVPRIWEKYHSGIVLKMADATWLKHNVFNLAYKIGTKYNSFKLAGKPIPWYLFLGYHFAYFCVFWKLKQRLGFDKVRLGFSGAAPISHEVLKFFQSIGIPIREGYGLTETTGITHMSDEEHFKVGTVGRALPDSEVKIAEDGEILIKHGGIFQGYFKEPEATAEALEGGWFHTGDHYCPVVSSNKFNWLHDIRFSAL